MSLILDALRKAENERNLGRAPQLSDLATTPAPQESSGARIPWNWLTLAVAALLLVALFLFLRRPAAPPPVATPVPVPTVVPIPAVAAPAEPAPSTASPAPPSEMQAVPAGDDALAEADEDSLATLDDLLPPAPEPELPPPVAQVEPQPVPVAPPPGAGPRVSTTPAQRSPQIATLKLEPPSTSGVPRLNELPPSVRGDFPSVSFDVHVWNQDPARRFVLIGGKRYNQGDRLPQGPALKEIVPDGVVFDHHGNPVLVPVRR